MKKFVIYLRLYWMRIVLITLVAAVVIGTILFMYNGLSHYRALEAFSRRQIFAQMAMMFPMFLLVQLITLPVYMGMSYFMMRGGGLGKLKVNEVDPKKINISWDDVIGMESAKKEAWELIKLLKDRAMVHAIGGRIIKGTLMIGPPGCGKTYLAKAIASECGLPLLPAVGSEFVGMFVGQGAAQMKSLFKQARALASLHGGCIIFIDEIDSFARPRMADRGFGGGISHNATINQFLTELDGLRQTENNIVVLAATNVQEGELDSAITRAGRFDRKIYVSRPNLKEREHLFQFYLNKIKFDPSCNAAIMARRAVWFSPSDINSMVREASLVAIRDGRDTVNQKDLSEAYDRIAFGLKSNIVMTTEEKIWTAYHEAGHAIIGYLLHPTDDVIKASITPRKGSLGMVARRASEELYCSNRDELMADIKVMLGAYAAERIKFGKTSQGVGGGPGADFYSALSVARMMVYSYGMGKSGLIGDFTAMKNYNDDMQLSDITKRQLEEDVQEILQSCLSEVTEIIQKNRPLLEEFAHQLYKKEDLEYDEIAAIFDTFNLKPAPRHKINADEFFLQNQIDLDNPSG